MDKKNFSRNLNIWKKEYIEEISRKIKIIKKQKTSDGLEKHLTELMSYMIDDLPIQCGTCIFCNNFQCGDCPYGETHNCGKIHDGQYRLMRILEKKIARTSSKITKKRKCIITPSPKGSKPRKLINP